MKKTMRFILLIMIMITALPVLSGCGQSTSKGTANELDNGVSAIEDAMSNGRDSSQQTETDEVTDLRNGTSADTVATPDDFPNAYDYGSGKISDYSRSDMLRKMPEPDGNQTVFNTKADAGHIQALYLWEEGNVPAKTEFTKNMTGYFDEWDFQQEVFRRENS